MEQQIVDEHRTSFTYFRQGIDKILSNKNGAPQIITPHNLKAVNKVTDRDLEIFT